MAEDVRRQGIVLGRAGGARLRQIKATVGPSDVTRPDHSVSSFR